MKTGPGVPGSAGGRPGRCSRVKTCKSETRSKESEKDGSGAFANLPTPKQINRVSLFGRFLSAFTLKTLMQLNATGRLSCCQRGVCLPFPSRRKGIQQEPRGHCSDARNKFVNNRASVAQQPRASADTLPYAPASRGAHSASHPLSHLGPPFLKVNLSLLLRLSSQ